MAYSVLLVEMAGKRIWPELQSLHARSTHDLANTSKSDQSTRTHLSDRVQNLEAAVKQLRSQRCLPASKWLEARCQMQMRF